MRQFLKVFLFCFSLLVITFGLARTISPDVAKACYSWSVLCPTNPSSCQNLGLGWSRDCEDCVGAVGACYGTMYQPGYAGEDCSCGGAACIPAQGTCTGQLSCGAPACDCNQGAGVCSGCNDHGNPEACCGDQYHYNCTWNGSSCTGDSSSYQCQSTCSGKNESDCLANGCSWTGGDPTTDGSGVACATQCSQPTNGTCEDSCGNQHTCNRGSSPASTTIQGQKVLVPIDADDNLPTANSTPWNQSITLDGTTKTDNPYSFSTTVAFHTLIVGIPSSYSAGYTLCTSDQDGCGDSYHASTAPIGMGVGPLSGVVPITNSPASGTTSVWIHYCNSWTDTTICAPVSGTCGPGYKSQIDSCGNIRDNVECTVSCSFFQTFGGDVTFKEALSNSQLPSSSYFVSGRR